jgi:hypothetical protein
VDLKMNMFIQQAPREIAILAVGPKKKSYAIILNGIASEELI